MDETKDNLDSFGERTTLISVPEFIDTVLTKTSPKRSFSVIQNERFGLVFAKTGSIISGTVLWRAEYPGAVCEEICQLYIVMMIKFFISMTDTLVNISFKHMHYLYMVFFMIFFLGFTWTDYKTGLLFFFKASAQFSAPTPTPGVFCLPPRGRDQHTDK